MSDSSVSRLPLGGRRNLDPVAGYLRGEENDHRTAGQFIGWIIGRAEKKLRVKIGDEYQKHSVAIATMEQVQAPLAVWANRGTHSFDASPTEAMKLINQCEAALSVFNCDQCNTPVWFTKVGDREVLHCQCEKLQWKN